MLISSSPSLAGRPALHRTGPKTQAGHFPLLLPSLWLACCLARGDTGRWRLQELELGEKENKRYYSS